jgi:hypothetical protein
VINVGTISDGSAASAATALNAVYHLADLAGSDARAGGAGMGENLLVMGTTSAGNAVLFQYGVFQATSAHPNGIVLASPDTAHTGSVTAAELQPIATLVGVSASSLTAADL